MSEIEAFPRAVLKHRYPETPLHGDFTTIQSGKYGPIDLLVGGTPCQSFSIAGLRGGLHDHRGNVALEYLRLADRLRPRWLVWENVPGAFSAVSHDSPDFCPPDIDLDSGDGPADGEEVVVEDSYDADETHSVACMLAGFSELGYGWAYRVLDAQFTGVPQRRRRIFLVGYLGDWRRAAAVLFERHSLSGNPPPRREAGKSAPTIPSRSSAGGGLGTDFDCDGGLIQFNLRGREGGAMPETADQASLRSASGGSSRSYLAFDTTQITRKTNRSRPREGDPCHTLAAGAHAPAIAFTGKDHGADAGEIAPTLRSMGHDGSHANGGGQVAVAVRRLTPRECERLMGLPDDYTLIPWRGGMASDGPRYKALGNSMAVPVMAWIGQRIAAVEALSSHRSDEMYVGGKEANKHKVKKFSAGRSAVGKTAVLGMRERGASAS